MPQVLLELDLMAGKHLENFIDRADAQRISSAEYRSHEKAKKRRVSVDQAKTRVHNTLVNNEGVSYGAGEF